mmetsp:Transcript_15484/g.30223  ORF Transcript_15484/g.30223 Transcript_15484/m.30223 type:complete len:90 (+) Transcript_15484:3-272(+)
MLTAAALISPPNCKEALESAIAMPSSSLRCPAGQNGLRSIVTESGLCKMTLFQYEAHRAPQPDDVFSACIVIECRMARAKSRLLCSILG